MAQKLKEMIVSEVKTEKVEYHAIYVVEDSKSAPDVANCDINEYKFNNQQGQYLIVLFCFTLR